MDSAKENQGCGCINVLVLVDMVALGMVGFRIGSAWGVLPAIGGAIVGGILGFPATGVLMLGIGLIAYILEWALSGSRE